MECKEFTPVPLPYGYDSLEPYINGQTLQVHHNVLYQKYITNLNAALKKHPEYCGLSLKELILISPFMPEDISKPVFNSAGGAYNHQVYFEMMNPKGTTLPDGWLLVAIKQTFGSIEEFQKQFKAKAMSVFGSGWTWLAVNCIGGLEIVNTGNQETPYTLNLIPIIPIDIWEHAYFLQYEANREGYVDGWLKLADWKKAEKAFELELY